MKIKHVADIIDAAKFSLDKNIDSKTLSVKLNQISIIIKPTMYAVIVPEVPYRLKIYCEGKSKILFPIQCKQHLIFI